MPQKYRLGIDVGTTSLGWCAVAINQENEPTGLINMGVRIFPDGRDAKTKEPLAVTRRGARGMRRAIDRRKLHRYQLMDYLVERGFFPKDIEERKALEKIDPYYLRATALDKKLPLPHLARALFHLCQRRGFKSNRKSDKREEETGNMKLAIKQLESAIGEKQARTLGEYLYLLNKDIVEVRKRIPVRVKAHREKNRNVYNLYPDRSMYEKEVAVILDKQKEFYPEITDEVRKRIFDLIFYQRPLRKPVIGFCTFEFENKEPRSYRASPTFQLFRIWQDVNHLDFEKFKPDDPSMTREQKLQIVEKLKMEKKLSFGGIRKLLKDSSSFNLESDKRNEILGDSTAAALSHEERFGEKWFDFTLDQQEDIVDRLLNEENEERLVVWLTEQWGVSQTQAQEIANAPLEDDTGRLSLKAMRKILPHLEKGLRYDEACIEAGYHHSDSRTGEIFDHLPYYGEALQRAVIGGSFDPSDKGNDEKFFGKINNPTVHVSLNQIRRVVNAIINVYGAPHEVVIELARDLPLGKERLDALNRTQTDNKKANDKINEVLVKLNVKPNYVNRLQYKLWESLAKDQTKRACPFSGAPITEDRIFSGEFEIEHILPFSKSFNDDPANKVLSSRRTNRYKGNHSPFEAFGHSPAGYNWDEIIERAENMPENKRWRFSPNAWEIAKGKNEDMIARQLHNTQYIARTARQYLSFICHPDHVFSVSGQVTSLFRRKWGLNDLLGAEDGKKERGDHRHHAIDAFVIACTDRGMFQRISKAAGNMYDSEELWEKRYKLASNWPEPFPDYMLLLEKRLQTLVVSYKPDHGDAAQAISNKKRPYTIGALHEDTAYGLVKKTSRKGVSVYVTRKPLNGMLEMGNIEKIADKKIRERLTEKLIGLKEKSEEWKKALEEFSEEWNIKRLRVHIERTDDTLIGIHSRQKPDEAPYKYYTLGGNYCAEIYCTDKGKKAGQWQMEVTPIFLAHQKNHVPDWRKDNPTARLIMRLQKNDIVAYEDSGERKLARVRKLNYPSTAFLVDPLKAKLAKDEGWGASAKQLQIKEARKVGIDELGRISDPKGKKG